MWYVIRDARTGKFVDPISALYSELARQRLTDLDELLGLQDGVEPHVLGPEMKMLGQPIGCGGVRELVGFPKGRAVLRKHAHRRIVVRERLLRMQRIDGKRTLHGLIVLGERPVRHGAPDEEAPHALRIHDERAHPE